jgi:hypothetical protein
MRWDWVVCVVAQVRMRFCKKSETFLHKIGVRIRCAVKPFKTRAPVVLERILKLVQMVSLNAFPNYFNERCECILQRVCFGNMG